MQICVIVCAIVCCFQKNESMQCWHSFQYLWVWVRPYVRHPFMPACHLVEGCGVGGHSRNGSEPANNALFVDWQIAFYATHRLLQGSLCVRMQRGMLSDCHGCWSFLSGFQLSISSRGALLEWLAQSQGICLQYREEATDRGLLLYEVYEWVCIHLHLMIPSLSPRAFHWDPARLMLYLRSGLMIRNAPQPGLLAGHTFIPVGSLSFIFQWSYNNTVSSQGRGACWNGFTGSLGQIKDWQLVCLSCQSTG